MELYYCNIAEFDDLGGAEHLSDGRRERMARYRRRDDQARCLVAGLLLRGVLGDSELSCGPYGKPYRKGGPQFNLSHSGDYVVLAVSSSETGVDVEKIAPYSQAVAKKCFTKAERDWLFRQGSDAAFYRLWTGKESVMKAVGLGFRMPPESFEVLPARDGAHPIGGKTWFLQWRSLPGHEVCAATAAEDPARAVPVGRRELLGETPWSG